MPYCLCAAWWWCVQSTEVGWPNGYKCMLQADVNSCCEESKECHTWDSLHASASITLTSIHLSSSLLFWMTSVNGRSIKWRTYFMDILGEKTRRKYSCCSHKWPVPGPTAAEGQRIGKVMDFHEVKGTKPLLSDKTAEKLGILNWAMIQFCRLCSFVVCLP